MNENEKKSPVEETTTPAAAPQECAAPEATAETTVCAETESPAEGIAETADAIQSEAEASVCAETESPAEAISEATDDIEAKADLRRYHFMTKEQLMQSLRDIIASGELEAHKDVAAIKQSYYILTEKENHEAFDRFVEEGNAPEDYSSPVDPTEPELKDLLARFRELRTAHLEAQEQKRIENLERRRAILAELRTLADDIDDINRHYPRFQQLQQDFKDAGEVPPGQENETWKEYQTVTEQFYDRLKMNKDLRDLDFKKNLETKRRLVEEAKALGESKDVIDAFRRLQSLHEQWRETGPVAKEFRESLWEEFRAASSTVNRRHMEFFERRKAEEKLNEEKKTAFCEEVEAIDIDSLKSFREWDEKSNRVQEIQKEWKGTGPAPRKVNNAIYQRFRAACDRFFNAKSAFFKSVTARNDENLARKTALCEQAEAIAASGDENRHSVDEIIKLQKEWKTVGSVSRRQSNAIWERFQKACNEVFDRRRKETSALRSEQNANLRAKTEVTEKIRAISTELERGEAIAQLRVLQDEWLAIGHVPFSKKEDAYKAYREACDAIFDSYNVRENRRQMSRFEGQVRQMRADGGDRMFRERERLLRAYDQKRNELKTYENNMGFFNVKSQAGSTMIKELERKISRIKEDMKLLEEKIALLDKPE